MCTDRLGTDQLTIGIHTNQQNKLLPVICTLRVSQTTNFSSHQEFPKLISLLKLVQIKRINSSYDVRGKLKNTSLKI